MPQDDRQAAGDAGTRAARRPRRTREEILAAAERTFREKGYDGASIQDIADELGILKGTIYHHIKSKERMLFEIIAMSHREVLEVGRAAAARPGSTIDRIRAFIEADVVFAATHLTSQVFFENFRALTDEHRREVVGLRDEYDGLLRDLVIQGQREGCVCPDLDAKLVTFTIFAARTTLHVWYAPDGPISPEQLARSIADLLVGGLACDPAAHVPGHRLGRGQPTWPARPDDGGDVASSERESRDGPSERPRLRWLAPRRPSR